MAAQWVADAAAEAGVPLVRFPGPGVNGAQDYIDPLMEHPDVIVESQWKSLGAPRPQHYLDAQILHLAPDASLSAHDELATVIKVRQLLHVQSYLRPDLTLMGLTASDTLLACTPPGSSAIERRLLQHVMQSTSCRPVPSSMRYQPSFKQKHPNSVQCTCRVCARGA